MKRIIIAILMAIGIVSGSTFLAGTAQAQFTIDDETYNCLASQSEVTEADVTYKGHIMVYAYNDAGTDYYKELFYNGGDGSYTTKSLNTGIHGYHISGWAEAFVAGGSADVRAFNLYCVHEAKRGGGESQADSVLTTAPTTPARKGDQWCC